MHDKGLIDLGFQARDCAGWRWHRWCPVLAVMKDGSVALDVGVVVDAQASGLVRVFWPDLNDGRGRRGELSSKLRDHAPATLIPHLADPAARGILLDLVSGRHRPVDIEALDTPQVALLVASLAATPDWSKLRGGDPTDADLVAMLSSIKDGARAAPRLSQDDLERRLGALGWDGGEALLVTMRTYIEEILTWPVDWSRPWLAPWREPGIPLTQNYS